MEFLLAHCTALFSQHKGLLATFFLGGMTGSITHCLVMCGPLSACQPLCVKSCGKKTQAASMASLGWHIGRFTSYGLLGFISALAGRQIAASPYWPSLSAFMLALAGVMFLIASVPNCSHPLLRLSGHNAFMRGTLLAFMPCGLLYAALMMAATLANPLLGMFAMWLFVLGTLPALLLAEAGAGYLHRNWKSGATRIGRVVMAFNGLSLLVMAEHTMR